MGQATNCTVLRITNNGVFEADVDISMAGADVATADETVTGAGPSVFDVEPKQLLALGVGETREVKLWTFPKEPRLYCNSVVCCVKDNPNPVQFAVSCLGAVPSVVLHGPWEAAAAAGTTLRPRCEHDRLHAMLVFACFCYRR